MESDVMVGGGLYPRNKNSKMADGVENRRELQIVPVV